LVINYQDNGEPTELIRQVAPLHNWGHVPLTARFLFLGYVTFICLYLSVWELQQLET